jgi:hypothetical protein
LIAHENFTRFARFGLIDQSLLVVGFGIGFKFDKFITRRVGVAVRNLIQILPEREGERERERRLKFHLF